uniref:Uncharacterized protein n=1 Tax=Romanomermis culicivorax TaxID=13658 RepID=A0A915IUR4_ROMCU
MGYFHSRGFNFKCKFCGAKLLKSEAAGRASKCCHNGSADLRETFEILQKPPGLLRDLCNPEFLYCQQFLKKAHQYNNEFAFGSMAR